MLKVLTSARTWWRLVALVRKLPGLDQAGVWLLATAVTAAEPLELRTYLWEAATCGMRSRSPSLEPCIECNLDGARCCEDYAEKDQALSVANIHHNTRPVGVNFAADLCVVLRCVLGLYWTCSLLFLRIRTVIIHLDTYAMDRSNLQCSVLLCVARCRCYCASSFPLGVCQDAHY